jgi:hypothetical protein
MKAVVISVFTLLSFSMGVSAWAHTPLMSCFDAGDGNIICEGGFSDGSSASGVNFRVEQDGKIILETKLDQYGEVQFSKPDKPYEAVFDAGAGHKVRIKSKDIF